MKINKQPLWSLRDFSDYVGLGYATIQCRMQKTDEENKPAIMGRKARHSPHGRDNLYYLNDLKVWFQKSESNLKITSSLTNKFTTKFSGSVKKINTNGYEYYKGIIHNDGKKISKSFGVIKYGEYSAKKMAEDWLKEKQKEIYPDFKELF